MRGVTLFYLFMVNFQFFRAHLIAKFLKYLLPISFKLNLFFGKASRFICGPVYPTSYYFRLNPSQPKN